VLVETVLAGTELAETEGLTKGEPKADKTWITVNNKTYGAKPDINGPLGGGRKYKDIITTGDIVVEDLESLIEGMKNAKPGQVVFIPGNTMIDFTTFIYIDNFVLEIPEGVTLAGDRGHNGSEGALLKSDVLDTKGMLRAAGPDVRISGLRIQGPDPNRRLDHHARSFNPGGMGRDYYYKFPISNGISCQHPGLEVDNCIITGFSHSGIFLKEGENHHIHHNYIHKCQYNGLGYGVCHDVASSVIEFNLFNSNRHSIAGTGRSGCSYIARNNVEIGISLSHCFDMHGGRDRKDGTSVAGTNIEIYNNTFYAPQYAVNIRGEPESQCLIYQNWFVNHMEKDDAVFPCPKNSPDQCEKIEIRDNVYGKDTRVPK
jgi:hypothetical protein